MAIMIVLIVGAFTVLLLPASASSSASVGGYTLSFVGPVVYNDDGTSTWNYSLKWDGNDPMLSHFIIEVGTCAKIVGYSTSGAEKVEIGHDNKTDITGIKWEFNDFPANDGVAFSFTLDGHYGAGQVGFGAKAGGNANVGAITGPSLSCDVVIDGPEDGGEDGDDEDNDDGEEEDG
ncbi:MAG TPA: hypothetical protein DE036_01565, partial [Actinobacteria bacterium]|nr:hypothetical protein [Actinomycetota bacterium]